ASHSAKPLAIAALRPLAAPLATAPPVRRRRMPGKPCRAAGKLITYSEPSMATSFILNGKPTTLDADPDMPLLWAIREVAGLHGTKFGCGMAQCGACTVHLEGQPIRSCITPLAAVEGRHITTIEGLQGKPAKAVQAAWVKLQ